MTVCALYFAVGIHKGREYLLVLNHPAFASYIHTMLTLLFIHIGSILQYTSVEFIIQKDFRGYIVCFVNYIMAHIDSIFRFD